MRIGFKNSTVSTMVSYSCFFFSKNAHTHQISTLVMCLYYSSSSRPYECYVEFIHSVTSYQQTFVPRIEQWRIESYRWMCDFLLSPFVHQVKSKLIYISFEWILWTFHFIDKRKKKLLTKFIFTITKYFHITDQFYKRVLEWRGVSFIFLLLKSMLLLIRYSTFFFHVNVDACSHSL